METPPIKTNIKFINCASCSGFGYELSPQKEHLLCTACHAKPPFFAILDRQLLFWGQLITQNGITERKFQRSIHTVFNIMLMAWGVLGLSAFLYSAYLYFYPTFPSLFGLADLFTTPNKFLAVFWLSLATDFLLYYRLDLIKASQKSFDYSLSALKKEEKEKKHFKWPANPTYEKFQKQPQHKKIDIASYFTTECLQTIEHAYLTAKRLDHHQITPLHLLVALLDGGSVATMMVRLGISKNALVQKIGKAMSREGIESGRGIDLGLESRQIFFYAFEEARLHKRKFVDTMELFIAIIHHDPWVSEIFYDLEIEEKTLQHVIEWIHIQRNLVSEYQQWSQKSRHKPKGIMDRAMTARPSPVLESLAQDYTGVALNGGFFPMFGRQKEMAQVMRILTARNGNILLVGPAGGGKSTILQGIAERMAAEDMPPQWQDKRFLVLDPGALVANAQGVGAIEGRMLAVIKEVNVAGNILLGIEDIHHLLNMRSTTGSEDAGSILMNALSQGYLQVVATTTTQEYQEFIGTKETFLRRFQVVKIEELDRDDAILVLEAKAGELEYKHKVFFTYAAIEAAVDLSSAFIQDRYLPAKALDIIAEAATYTQNKKGDNSLVSKEEIAEIISEKTNVQVTAITEDEKEKLLNLESIMHQRVVGQEEAIIAIASALRRAREGLRDVGRPIANLLFLGPTGVGKTETAKTIAEVYFGNEKNMIRLDMSEYQDVDALSKLIGHKGERGILTEAVRLKPFSLVLLDEFEKAHPDILNIFLQVMDDGRLTDGLGRTVDLSNCMIIATSNAATQQIQNGLTAGLKTDQIKNKLMEEVLPRIFKPELLNRFDNVVMFSPLNFDQVLLITEKMVHKLTQKLQEQRGIVLVVSKPALLEVAKKGYDPLYGARPLRRAIQDTIDDAVAKLLLSEKINRRDKIILEAGGEVRLERAARL